jgi:hypothetical protein
MLGMVYGDFCSSDDTPAVIANMVLYTTQQRRDTARCIATEVCSGREVFTLDTRGGVGGSARPDRHIVQDLKKINLDNKLMREIKGRVHQITLDHFWFNSVYWDTRAGLPFFKTSSPKLQTLLEPGGAIYVGLSIHLLLLVLELESHLEKYFVISLVPNSESAMEIDLVRGSHRIDDALHADLDKLGCKDQKPETALEASYKMLRETCPETSDFKTRVRQLEKLAGKRRVESHGFIKLQNMSTGNN